jgi:hypothetical protein
MKIWIGNPRIPQDRHKEKSIKTNKTECPVPKREEKYTKYTQEVLHYSIFSSVSGLLIRILVKDLSNGFVLALRVCSVTSRTHEALTFRCIL